MLKVSMFGNYLFVLKVKATHKNLTWRICFKLKLQEDITHTVQEEVEVKTKIKHEKNVPFETKVGLSN